MNKNGKQKQKNWFNILDIKYVIPFVLAIFIETSAFLWLSNKRDYPFVHFFSIILLFLSIWIYNTLANSKKEKKNSLEADDLRLEIKENNLKNLYRLENELNHQKKINYELQLELKGYEKKIRLKEQDFSYHTQDKNIQIAILKERLAFVKRTNFEDSSNTENIVGIQSLYLDYKTLTLKHFKEILQSLENLFLLIYGVNINKPLQKNELNKALKANPIDILRIESIHTGNSIIIKTKTGWLPSIDTIDGNFELALPKGAIALIFVGYLLQNAISFGITNYKEILEIKKLKIENKSLRLQLDELHKNCLELPDNEKMLLEKEILNFHFLTIEHHNINAVTINDNNKISK